MEDRLSLQVKHMERLDSEVKELAKYMANYVTQQELHKELVDKLTYQ